jgi:hypothetical protein
MRLKIKGKNVQRLASLSALGVGALGIAGTAEANVVVTDVNQTVGFTTGGPGPITVKFGALGAGSFSLKRTAFTTMSSGSVAHVKSVFLDGHHGLRFGVSFFSPGGRYGAFPYGRTSSGLIARKTVPVAGLATLTSVHGSKTKSTLHPFQGADKYFLFYFPSSTTPSGDIFGWGQLTESINLTTGPDVTLVDYAYDTSGNFLPAGAVPEPSETVPLALGALVLGAAGIRRWRGEKAA